MGAKRLLVHVAYAILIALAFTAGRFSIDERRGSEAVSMLESPSLLNSVSVSDTSNTLESSEDVAESPPEALPTGGFAQQVAEMLKVGNVDYYAFSEVIEAWVDSDPVGAIDFLVRGERRDDMLRWIVSVWGRKHPEDASRWLAQNEQLEGLDHAIEGLTQGIEKEDPDSAMEWAKMIEDPSMQTRVWAASGFQKYRHDHDAAVASLADSKLPIEAQEAIVKSWADSWKRTAKRNSQNVSSVAAAARAAGGEFDTSSMEAYVESVRKGIRIESGAFKGTFFGVPNLTALEGEAVLDHLRMKGEVLAYTPGDD